MNKLLSCEFNIDTGNVECRFADGTMISIDCDVVEDTIDGTLPFVRVRTELDWLIYNAPREYVQLVLNGGLNWLIQFSTKYHLSYMGAVSELLKQLDSLHSYDLLNQYAMKSLTIAPDNPKAYCWLIRSLKAQGMNELATNELAAAKEHLTTEEYEEILAFGANW